jgi:hypothetical protein
MRNLFPGYYQPSENEFQKIWQECIFACDASFLLNVYRYSPKVRERFFDVLSKLKDKIWVPYQAAYEYQKNRHSVISQQSKADDEIKKVLSENSSRLQNLLKKYEKHPFIKIDEIQSLFEEYREKCESILNAANLQHKQVDFDKNRDNLDEILSQNIGEKYEKDLLEKIYKQAQQRFDEKIPPGYMDKGKENPEKYGDFIIWNQLIDYASSQKKPLIFVTDDAKEDWWRMHEGKKISPRPELVEEMQSRAGVFFYMYSSDNFMNYADKFLNLPYQQEIIEEVRDIRLKNEEEQLKRIQTFNRAKELAHQAAAIPGLHALESLTKIDPATLKVLLQPVANIDPVILENALQLKKLNSDVLDKTIQSLTKIDPATLKVLLQPVANIDPVILENALQLKKLNSDVLDKIIQSLTRIDPAILRANQD